MPLEEWNVGGDNRKACSQISKLQQARAHLGHTEYCFHLLCIVFEYLSLDLF